MRIVDNQQISTLTSHRTTHTNGKIVPLPVGVPPTSSLRVARQGDAGENLSKIIRLYEVPHLTTKANRQFGSVCRLNDLLLGKSTQKPSRQEVRSELRLGVTRRHVDNQPLQLTFCNPFKGFRHDLMVPTTNKTGPHHLHKGQEFVLRCLLVLSLLKFGQKIQQLSLLLHRQVAYLALECRQIHERSEVEGRQATGEKPTCPDKGGETSSASTIPQQQVPVIPDLA